MKRLTVIIPGYRNPDAWWHRCVMSVLKAIGPEDEIICVDDGSPVKPQLDELTNSDARVHVIYRSQNGGLSVARNTALDVMQSQYVTFVDSDDEVVPDVYARTISMMRCTNSAVGLFGVKVVWDAERLTKCDLPENKAFGALTPEDVERLSQRCLLNYACNKVYDVQGIRRMLIDWDFRFDEGGMPCEDIIFNLHVLMAGVSWCGVAVLGYVYHRTDGTLLSRYKPTNGTGERHAAEAWRSYCAMNSKAACLFARKAEWSDDQQAQSDWDNMWRSGSPYGLAERWTWLRQHQEFGGWGTFLKTALRSLCRRHLYVTALRRIHIRHLYPHVVPLERG